MRKFIIAAALATAAIASAPAFAGEGTYQPTTVASGFGPVAAPVAAANGSFRFNNAGNYGDNYLPAAMGMARGARLSAGSFDFNMGLGQG